jgi:hypothetical protein
MSWRLRASATALLERSDTRSEMSKATFSPEG